MIPFDTKNYKATRTKFKFTFVIAAINIVVLLIASVAWISNIEREERLFKIREAAVSQCAGDK
jgi:aminopeptidase-like protein